MRTEVIHIERELEGKCGLWGQCGILPETSHNIITSAIFCNVIKENKKHSENADISTSVTFDLV